MDTKSNSTTLNPALNILMNGVMEQLVETLTEAVVEKMPYFKDLDASLRTISAGIDELHKRIDVLEDVVLGKGELTRMEQIEKSVVTLQQNAENYVSSQDVEDVVNEQLPDFEDLVTEHLPDMDDYVLKSDVEDVVAEHLPDMEELVTKEDLKTLTDSLVLPPSPATMVADIDDLKTKVRKLDENVVGVRVLFNSIAHDINESLGVVKDAA